MDRIGYSLTGYLVMALAIASDGSFAVSVSADHLLARYEIHVRNGFQ